MRRLFFLLLILLLPLRGWTGDAMANHLAIPTPMQQISVLDLVGHTDRALDSAHAHPAANPVVTAAGDCESHGDPDDTRATDTTISGACSECQTCHAVALLHLLPLLLHGSVPAAAPRSAGHDFTSADRALALKPPTT